MGTVFSQPERKPYDVLVGALEHSTTIAQSIAKRFALPFDSVVALMHVLELRRANDLAVANGDAWDEQISGVAEELQRIAHAFEQLQEKFCDD